MSPLASCSPGDQVVIGGIDGGIRARDRITALGLFPGTKLRVVSAGNGPVIVEIKGTRLGLCRGMAHKILVFPSLRP